VQGSGRQGAIGFLTGDKQSPSAIAANPITIREREVLIRIAQGPPQQGDCPRPWLKSQDRRKTPLQLDAEIATA
jgi:hypothetical protein